MKSAATALFLVACSGTGSRPAPSPANQIVASDAAPTPGHDAAVDAITDAPPAPDLRAFYGAATAAPGTLFDGITLGAMPSDAVRAKTEEQARAHGATVELGDDIAIVLPEATCDPLSSELTSAWGPSRSVVSTGTSFKVWVDLAAHRRAYLSAGGGECILVFERVAAVADVFVRKHTPIDLLGTRADKLPPDDGTGDAQRRKWTVPGLGTGIGPTRVVAWIDRGRVITIEVWAAVDRETFDAVRARLIELYGKPVSDDQDGTEWKRGPIHLLNHDPKGFEIELIAGQTPD